MKTLKDVKVGETVVIEKLHGEGALKQRADLVAPSNELGGVADMLELVLQGSV